MGTLTRGYPFAMGTLAGRAGFWQGIARPKTSRAIRSNLPEPKYIREALGITH